jgi:hypothetical protein
MLPVCKPMENRASTPGVEPDPSQDHRRDSWGRQNGLASRPIFVVDVAPDARPTRDTIDDSCRAEDLITPGGGLTVSNAAPRRDPDLPVHEPQQVVFQQVKLRAPRASVVVEELG